MMSKLVFVIFLCVLKSVRSEDGTSQPFFFDNSSAAVVTVREFSTAVLECYAGGNPPPKVLWRDALGLVLPTLEFTRESNVYQISQVRREAMLNQYECVADNGVGEKAHRQITLKVTFPPDVSINKNELYEAVGYDVYFYCFVLAYPWPKVVWTKDGQPVTNDTHLTISQSTSGEYYTTLTLEITKVQERDFGTYICKAENELGAREDTIHVKKAERHECPPVCKDPPVIMNSTTRISKIRELLS